MLHIESQLEFCQLLLIINTFISFFELQSSMQVLSIVAFESHHKGNLVFFLSGVI